MKLANLVLKAKTPYWKFQAIELAAFESDSEDIITFQSAEMSLDDLVRNYNDSVREAVDKHSLVRTKVVTCHVQACVMAN
jgi:hypothetical protein